MIAVEIDLESILDSKIAPKSIPRESRRVLDIMVVFACPRTPLKMDFLVNMAPTWPQLGRQDGTNLEPKWEENLSKNGFGSEVGSGAEFGSILGRFGTDSGSIFD